MSCRAPGAPRGASDSTGSLLVCVPCVEMASPKRGDGADRRMTSDVFFWNLDALRMLDT